MKFSTILKSAVVLSFLSSCSSALKDVSTPELDIKISNNAGTETTTFNVGDTINYNFAGQVDNISFYSGEIGYRYKYEGSDSDTSTNVVYKFATAKNVAGAATLTLLISTDFKGYMGVRATDSANVNAAHWTDISSRASWATGTTTVQSGSISLSDYAAKNTPISLAYRYDGVAGATQTKYTVSAISLRHYARDTSYLIDSSAYIIPALTPAWSYSGGWGRILTQNKNAPFVVTNGSSTSTLDNSITTTTSFVHSGDTSAAKLASQTWLVSGPIDLRKVLPETNIALKNATENMANIHKGFYASQFANFTYQYMRPGQYEVVFKLYNGTIDKSAYSLKKFTITIK